MDALFLLGPTAAGKSAAALALARELDLEIVSVDSALVYRGMDIGTAKPIVAERRGVPHHLIDLIDPLGSYSAARFVAEASRLIDEIRARGKLALLVGGTMLYARALQSGLDSLPAAHPELRAELDAQARQLGWPALHARLARIDPVTAARLKPGDSQRIQRALEVYELTGQPLSELVGQSRPLALTLPVISLEPSDRSVLHRHIAKRFEQMLAEGLVQEVEGLRARGDLDPGLPSMRCVGYRQVWSHLSGEISYAAMVEAGIAATRQLAKRQITWLRAMPERQVIDSLAPDAIDQVLRAVLSRTGRSRADRPSSPSRP